MVVVAHAQIRFNESQVSICTVPVLPLPPLPSTRSQKDLGLKVITKVTATPLENLKTRLIFRGVFFFSFLFFLVLVLLASGGPSAGRDEVAVHIARRAGTQIEQNNVSSYTSLQ